MCQLQVQSCNRNYSAHLNCKNILWKEFEKKASVNYYENMSIQLCDWGHEVEWIKSWDYLYIWVQNQSKLIRKSFVLCNIQQMLALSDCKLLSLLGILANSFTLKNLQMADNLCCFFLAFANAFFRFHQKFLMRFQPGYWTSYLSGFGCVLWAWLSTRNCNDCQASVYTPKISQFVSM